VKLPRLLAVLAAFVALSAVAVGSASATTLEECEAELAAQASFTNPKDVDGLLGKLDAASAKLDQGKNADALAKLVDYQSTLNPLAGAAKPKVDPAVAQTLSADAQGVIDCINAIGAP
jgi:hypothetical protein